MSDSDKQALIDGSATVQTEIVVHNENLFDKNNANVLNATINTSNKTITAGSSNRTIYIPCEPNTTYTLSKKSSPNNRVIGYSSTLPTTGTVLDYVSTITSNLTTKTITTGNDAQYLVVWVWNVGQDSETTFDEMLNSIRIEEGTPISLTETNSVIDWNHEDFRLVKEEGWIGQFVARQVTGNLKDLSDDFSITDKELELKLGVRTNNNTNWYSLGNFLVTKVTDDEVNDKTSFEALDYTKKFNKAFVDRLNYPVTALELTQDVCDQCGVELGSSTFKNSDYVIQGNAFTNNESCRDVMKAIGKLAFSWVRVDWDNKVYIDFDPLPFKNQFDKDNANVLNAYFTASSTTITSGSSDRTIYIPCNPNTTYTISKKSSPNARAIGYTSTPPTIGNSVSGVINITANTTTGTITTGNDAKYLVLRLWNSGQDSGTTFDEMKATLQIKEQPSQYETFGNNKYYNLKTQKEVFGPVDKVVIGYSAIEGEKTYIGDENGTCVINVLDNPLVFNQEQRAAIIESARDLLGFTYTPLNTLTVGHPWLKGNEIVRVNDMESVSHDTIPFDRTIQYFGHIKTLINSITETKTNDNLSYKPEMVKNYERSEIYNDQINKQIGIIINEQTDTSNRLNETISTLDGTIQRVSNNETSINDITTTTQVSTGKNSLYLEDAMEGNALSYSVDGATEQDGTPTPDNPVEVKTIPSIINLFDKDNANVINCSMSSSAIANSSSARMIYIPITGGKTYTISKIQSARFRVATTETIPASGVTISNYFSSDSSTSITITANSSAKYICAYIYLSTADTLTPQEIINTIMIEEGSVAHEYVPYGYWSKVKVTGKNICNGINQNYFINTGATGCGIASGNSGLYVKTNGATSMSISTNTTQTRYRAICMNAIPTSSTAITGYNGVNKDNTSDSFTIDTTGYSYLFVNATDLTQIQIEYGEPTTYEPYKENQVLIDMSKENLFDKDNVTPGYRIDSNGLPYATTGYNLSDFIPVKPNTNYYRNKTITTNNALAFYDSSKTFIERKTSGNLVTTTANTYYIRTDINDNDLPTTTLFEGNNPTPYYELCKIGDYKDTLSIDSSGNCVINKNVVKRVLNGSENWTVSSLASNTWYSPTTNAINPTTTDTTLYSISNYYERKYRNNIGSSDYGIAISNSSSGKGNVLLRNTDISSVSNLKTWLSTHNTDVYYPLATPETINLPNTKIPLFEGINHVTFVDDLETNTTITYYRKTPLSGTYATVTQLNEVSTEKTQEIIQVRNEVQTEITSTQASINVINETIENGVSKVNGTGYTFDSEGLKIEKTNQDVKSLLDNDGLAVSYKGTDLLTVRSNGIEAENMTVRKFYVQRPIRMEKTKSISDGSSVGLGFFYVGEED